MEQEHRMTFTLGLAQSCHPSDGDVLALVDRFAAQAASRGVDLLVFPESLMTRYEVKRQAFLEAAQPVDGPFSRGVRQIAARHGLWMVYTLNERAAREPDFFPKPFNTAVLCDSQGEIQGIYRKTHLFDTDFTRESDRMGVGDSLFSPIRTPFGTIGLAICYDLRFPEIARHAALRGCQLMIYPAAWVDGPTKASQWKTLLASRAIENEMFVAGVCRGDAGYVGCSCVVDPRGQVLACGPGNSGAALASSAEDAAGASSGCEELVVAQIDLGTIDKVRAAMPVFDHRRPELYV